MSSSILRVALAILAAFCGVAVVTGNLVAAPGQARSAQANPQPAQANSPQTHPVARAAAQPKPVQANLATTRPAGASARATTRPADGSTRATTQPASRTAKATTRPAAQGPLAQSRPATRPAPRSNTPAPQLVRFATHDNMLIAGAYTPPQARKGQRAPMAILLHMYASDHAAFDPLIPALHMAGFACLAIDLRGHGQSVGPPEMGLAQRVADRDRKFFATMDRDVEGAYAWLSKQPGVDPSRFVLVGASVGCSVALKYAGRDRSVDAVVCLTPGTGYMGIDSLSDARKYGNRQMLLLASEEERTACEELARLVPGAVVQIGPSVGSQDRMSLHGTRLLGQMPNVEQIITAFLVKAAGPATSEVVLASVQGEVYHEVGGGGTSQINPENIRWFSSPAEAEARGLRPPKTKSRGSSRSSGRTGWGRPSAAGEEPFPGSDAGSNARKGR